MAIKSFKHRGLKAFFETGSKAGIQPDHAKRLAAQLKALSDASKPDDMSLPGYRFHELKGDRKGIYSITVSGNWRITFRFIEKDAEVVNYEDSH